MDNEQLGASKIEAAKAEIEFLQGRGWAAAMSQGLVRSENQDMFGVPTGEYSLPSNVGLFVVTDGMGGEGKGKEASREATRQIFRHFSQLTMTGELSSDHIAASLLSSMQEAAGDVREATLGKGGTTADVAVIYEDQLILGHIGDGRVYELRVERSRLGRKKYRLEQLTRDHNYAGEAAARGISLPENFGQNQLLRCLGGPRRIPNPYSKEGFMTNEINEVKLEDIQIRGLTPNHLLVVLCTDGLTKMVDDDGIQKILVANRENPSEAACQLVARALENGGKDNIAVVVIKPSDLRTIGF